MYFVRSKQDGKYLGYVNGDNTSTYTKQKDAIQFETLEEAKGFKAFASRVNTCLFEIVEVVVTTSVIEED